MTLCLWGFVGDERLEARVRIESARAGCRCVGPQPQRRSLAPLAETWDLWRAPKAKFCKGDGQGFADPGADSRIRWMRKCMAAWAFPSTRLAKLPTRRTSGRFSKLYVQCTVCGCWSCTLAHNELCARSQPPTLPSAIMSSDTRTRFVPYRFDQYSDEPKTHGALQQ